jgi:hypothetical protein
LRISAAAGAIQASTEAIGKSRSDMAAWSRQSVRCYVPRANGLGSSSRTTAGGPRAAESTRDEMTVTDAGAPAIDREIRLVRQNSHL